MCQQQDIKDGETAESKLERLMGVLSCNVLKLLKAKETFLKMPEIYT